MPTRTIFAVVLFAVLKCCHAQPLPVVTVAVNNNASAWSNPFTNVSGLYIELLGLASTNWTGTTTQTAAAARWIDLSGAGNDFTNYSNAAMNPPAYGAVGPSGFFAADFKDNSGGGSRLLKCIYDLETNGPNTVIVVCTETNAAASSPTIYDSKSGTRSMLRTGVATPQIFAGNAVTLANFNDTQNWFIFSVVYNGINAVIRTNGILCKRGNTGSGYGVGEMILGNDRTLSTPYTGKIFAVLAYNRGLLSNELAYVEGQLNTLMGTGYTITTNSGFDTGSVWADRVVINGGAAPADATKVAVTALANGLASDGVYPKIAAMVAYPPDNLIAAATPVIGYLGGDPWTNHNFVGGDLTANGLKGNKTTKYLDSGIVPSALTANSTAIFTYDISIGTAAGVSFASVNTSVGWFELDSDNGGNANSIQYHTTGGFLQVATHGAGYYCGSRTSSTVHNLYYAKTGTAHSSIANQATSGGLLNALSMLAFAANVNGSASAFSDIQSGAMGVCTGLTATDSSNLYNRLVTFRTAVGGTNP